MERFLKILKQLWLPLLIIAAAITADLTTKLAIEKTIALGKSVTIIPKFLFLTYAQNLGAAFSMLSGAQTFLKIITPFAVAGFFAFLVCICSKNGHILLKVSLALIIAGALGNFADRVAFGYVRDFIHIHYFGLDLPLLGTDFAIFNVADSALTVGVVIFAVYYLFLHKDKTAAEAANLKKEKKVLEKKHSMSVEEYLALQTKSEKGEVKNSEQ